MSVVEDTYCPDVFVSGVDHIEKLDNGMIRVVLYAERVEPTGEKVRVIVARIVRPLASVVPISRMFAQILNDNAAFVAETCGMIPMH